jgi:hypothetical protein
MLLLECQDPEILFEVRIVETTEVELVGMSCCNDDTHAVIATTVFYLYSTLTIDSDCDVCTSPVFFKAWLVMLLDRNNPERCVLHNHLNRYDIAETNDRLIRSLSFLIASNSE